MAFLQSLHALFMSSAICCLKKSASREQCVTSGRHLMPAGSVPLADTGKQRKRHLVLFNTVRPLRTFARRKKTFRSVMGTVVGLVAGPAAALFLSYCGFRLHFNLSIAGSIDLLIVVLTALRFGFWEATGSSVAAIACLDYFF